jgi:quercetin dioxygenase-like cupin family protein
VIVGVNTRGASTVVADRRDLPITQLDNGIVLQELWQQRALPARSDDQPQPAWTLGPAAPSKGAVVRILTVPALTYEGGRAAPDLHTDASLHVITMLEGELVVILEEGEVTLGLGDSIVLRGSMHDLLNTRSTPATFIYTSFPLVLSGPRRS